MPRARSAATTGVLGIDVGTSRVKALLVDVTGAVRGSAARCYPLSRPVPGAAEADPADWWAAAQDAVRSVLSAVDRHDPLEVAAVGVAGQMHGLVLVDGEGRPVRRAITWADTRARGQLARWRALPEPDRARLANPIVPGMLGPELAWVADREPAVVAAAAHVLLPKDWLRHRLTGVIATDPTDASATLLWDLPADRWARDLTASLGLPVAMLPPVRPSQQVIGPALPASAGELGFPAGVPVVAGAADTAAALLATGLPVGRTQLTVGSGAQVIRVREAADAVADPITHLYRATEPGRWYAMAAIQNAGLALDWVRGVLGVAWSQVYASLDEGHATPDERRGPVFIPYLTGERTPVLNAEIRGAWKGLDLCHTREDLLRAALLGVACAIRHALEALPGPAPESVWVAGGGTSDQRWRELLADVLGTPVEPLEPAGSAVAGPAAAGLGAAAAVAGPAAAGLGAAGTSALGAALLAGQAVGLTVRSDQSRPGDAVRPGPRAAARQEVYQRYRASVATLIG